MYTIKEKCESLMEIKKSKFISLIYPISTNADVENLLTNLRRENKDATHICYAYILSSPNLEKCSDDGEPDGTAGKPMLDILKKNNLSDVLLVVIRYFGGIKLGAGGLVRAYAGAGSDVIKLCQLGTFNDLKTIRISCDIPYAKKLLDYLRNNNVKVISQEYSNLFSVKVAVEDENILCALSDEYIKEQLETTKVFYDKDNEN